jgi:hypothetical protein
MCHCVVSLPNLREKGHALSLWVEAERAAVIGGDVRIRTALLAYVRWATLESTGPQRAKFEQQSALTSCDAWEHSAKPLTDEDINEVDFNPTPSML